MDAFKKGSRGALVSIIVYFIISITKLVVSYVADSQALRADGLNNATDVISSVIIFIGLRIAVKPADHNHRYGHARAEMIASLVASFIMLTVSIQVLTQSITNLINRNYPEPGWLAFWVASISGFILFIVYRYNYNLSQSVKSHALKAASLDNRADSLISFAAAIGIIGTRFGLFWLDPVLSLFVGLLIAKTAYDTFIQASHTLSDGFDPEMIKKIKLLVLLDPDVLHVSDIRGRTVGSHIMIDMIIYVDPDLTIKSGHDITDRIEAQLTDQLAIEYTTIHVEPYSNK
ncbi:putative transporter YeaB [Halolactibacillus alkaliphilus]|uniref:Putative transporter YeaB n=1 Tax=Halolactibacillus alkaliphilus TaxID=442899 RepID=A0A511X1Q1_9BACI|nr:cation diffusion facilitator family transporter [Halolactibacillus alkaliphilus]GEN56865.1 putative transporter YeaB [Halolactibacillus alkaliphilus]GGN71384.1 putative transporter YeaB [Halolactibacillus alkaliphilus]SFO82362.1 cation diffusion facilitator family transporter [Halolactibacillus alkaliphilus]